LPFFLLISENRNIPGPFGKKGEKPDRCKQKSENLGHTESRVLKALDESQDREEDGSKHF